MSKPPGLLTLPVEIICMIFDRLPNMQSVASLATSRYHMLQVYNSRAEHIRTAQQEKILQPIKAEIRPDILSVYQYREEDGPLRRSAMRSELPLMPLPEGDWGMEVDKNVFALSIMKQLPYAIIPSRRGPGRIHVVRTKSAIGCLRYLKRGKVGSARQLEKLLAKDLKLTARNMIALVEPADVIIDAMTALVYWDDHERGMINVSHVENFFNNLDSDEMWPVSRVIAKYKRGFFGDFSERLEPVSWVLLRDLTSDVMEA